MKFKQRLVSISIAAAMSASTTMVAFDAQANSSKNKFLIAWMGDQMLDGNNHSPLDGILGLPAGTLPDADFIGVMDANPKSPTYGEMVNTAEMPAIYGEHALSTADDFVDEALNIALCNGADTTVAVEGFDGSSLSTLTGEPPASTADCVDGAFASHPGTSVGLNSVALGLSLPETGDILGGVPNFNYPGNGLPEVVPAPSSVLNEPHHHSVRPHVAADGSVNAYYGGLISSNIFGCDISDPMNIKPSPGSTTELDAGGIDLHGGSTANVCGLSASGSDSDFSGADDLEYDPESQMYYTTMMGAGGSFAGAYSPPSTSGASLPPLLTTPGGVMVFDPSTDSVITEVSAVPTAPVYGHGTYVNGSPMLGPKRYAPRVQISMGGVDGNGECTPGQIPTGAGVNAFNLCVPGVKPFNQIGKDTGAVDLDAGINEGPDTGLLAHPHGIGLRTDLNGTIADANGNVIGTTNGILMTSDYADPVSLALQSPGQGAAGSNQNFGTTIRLWDLSDVDAGPYQVIQMPDGNRHEFNAVQEEPEGLMAMRVTHGSNGAKGAFVASMNGGMLYYSPDITVAKPEFKGVYDFGACTGASVFTITQDDKHLIMPVSGMQMAGDPVYERDYDGQHDARIAVLDIKGLLNAGSSHNCDMASADKWDNSGVGSNPQFAGDSPLGQSNTQGTAGVVYNNPGDMQSGGDMHPNNGASDCPKLVDEVNLAGVGEDTILGTADDHPDSETTRGGPHFTTHDRNDKYIATANYFVDLREFAIKDVDLLLSALGANHGFDNSNSDSGTNAYPPGGPTTCVASGTLAGGDLAFSGGCPQGGLGVVHQALGIDGSFGNTLPGLGSVGDDTICMMKWNKKKQNLILDVSFNDGATKDGVPDDGSPVGCNDMDFGDLGKQWPAAGTRHPDAGNGTPHGMSFIKKGATSWFTNGET